MTGAELRYVESVRAAVCYALAAIDTTLGIPSVWLSRYAELEDRNQRVSALLLQKVAALQQGDWELAEKYRQEGELLLLQALSCRPSRSGRSPANGATPRERDYEVVLLAPTMSDTFCLSGVARLAKQGASRAGLLQPLAGRSPARSSIRATRSPSSRRDR